MVGITGVSYSLDETSLVCGSRVLSAGTGFNLMLPTGAPPHPELCVREDPFHVGFNGDGEEDDVDDDDDLDSDDDDDLEDEDFFDEEDDFLDDDDLDDDDDEDDEVEILSAINAPPQAVVVGGLAGT